MYKRDLKSRRSLASEWDRRSVQRCVTNGLDCDQRLVAKLFSSSRPLIASLAALRKVTDADVRASLQPGSVACVELSD